jgi:hypothetical protein
MEGQISLYGRQGDTGQICANFTTHLPLDGLSIAKVASQAN